MTFELFVAFFAGMVAGAALVLTVGYFVFRDGGGVRLPW